MTKQWFKSKTLWFNVVSLAVVVLDLITSSGLIKDKDVFAIAVAILNILLRFKTSQKLKV